MPEISIYEKCKRLEEMLIEEIKQTNRIVFNIRQMAKEKNKNLIAKLRELKES